VTRLKVSTLLKRARFLALQIKSMSNKTRLGSSLIHYYYKNKVTKKMCRKRSIAFVKSLKTNRFIKTLEELKSNFDLTPRIYRYVVWKILPNVLLDIAIDINAKLLTTVSLYIYSHLDSYWNKGSKIQQVRILQEDNTLLSLPSCIPRMFAHHLKWTSIEDPR